MGQESVLEGEGGQREDPDAQDRTWRHMTRTTLTDVDVAFAEHWALYQSVFADRPAQAGPPKAWSPSTRALQHANLTDLRTRLGFDSYEALHAWSSIEREHFWEHAIDRLGIPFHRSPQRILDPRSPPHDPAWLPGATLNIAEACFTGDPQRIAILSGQEGGDGITAWTYQELRAMVDRVSHGLVALGHLPGDRIALYMPMTAECVAAYLGIVQAGMAVVSIPDSFAPQEVATRLRLGDARRIITVAGFLRGGKRVAMYDKAAEAAAEADGNVGCIVIGPDGEKPLRDGDITWRSFLGRPGPFKAVPVEPQHPSNILFSSGTTGDPKAIPWTHLTPIKAAMDGHYHQDIHPDDVVAWPTNIGWMMGPWLIYASLVNGATMALYEGVPTGVAFLAFLRAARVSVMGVVPAIVRAWLASGVKPHSLPDVRVWSSTGEASNAHDYLYLMSLAGYRAPVIEYCGGTEIGGGHLTGTVVQPASPATFTTPALGLDFTVLDDGGRRVRPGGMGEIFLIPPTIGLSQRLLNRDHHKEYYAGAPDGPDGVPLRRHGDEIHVLHGGFFAAGGRADDTMNLGGIKVSSVELERAMDGHPGVLETAAVAIAPPGGGADRLVVFVVPEGAATDGLHEALQGRIKERLNPLFRIHDLVVVDALPRTASNKVMRRELRARYGA